MRKKPRGNRPNKKKIGPFGVYITGGIYFEVEEVSLLLNTDEICCQTNTILGIYISQKSVTISPSEDCVNNADKLKIIEEHLITCV